METTHSDDGSKANYAARDLDPPNSKAKAQDGFEYVPVPKPDDLAGTQAALNMWAVYLEQWMLKAVADVKSLEDSVFAAPVERAFNIGGGSVVDGAAPATHLDPPPKPPFLEDPQPI